MESISTNLEEMRNIDVRTVNTATLRDIEDVTVDTSLPKAERLKSYIEQIGNPYCYRHGKYVVKVSYSNSGKTMEDCLLAYLRSKC